MSHRVAVLLMDYGAPKTEAEVRPFIASVLSDPSILPLPWGLRHLLAHSIALSRSRKVALRYSSVGGSPLPAAVAEIAQALEKQLGSSFLVRPAYCHASPRVADVIAELAQDGVQQVVGLPLFPQRSWTTSDVCERQLLAAAEQHEMTATFVQDYPDAPNLVKALAEGIMPLLGEQSHVLMVAHGLPVRLEKAGDPYPNRIRMTAQALAAKLPQGQPWGLSFQSRLGPAAWTGPYLLDEVDRLAAEGVRDLVLVPLSFATDNLEICWDLDRDASDRARALGVDKVSRAPAPGGHPLFKELLRELVCASVSSEGWLANRAVQ